MIYVRVFSVLHNVSLQKLSVHIQGLFPIYHHFQGGETFILGKIGLYC
jgi:hypothetical protein